MVFLLCLIIFVHLLQFLLHFVNLLRACKNILPAHSLCHVSGPTTVLPTQAAPTLCALFEIEAHPSLSLWLENCLFLAQ